MTVNRYGHKRYSDSDPDDSKQGVISGTVNITPQEFDRLSDTYDSDLGYDYENGNPEPICYDSVDGVCYDSGEYYPSSEDTQNSYAKYCAYMDSKHGEKYGKYAPYMRKQQMKKAWDEANPWNDDDDTINNIHYLHNMDDLDRNGELAMRALDGDKDAQKGGSKRFNSQVMQNFSPWIEKSLDESKLKKIISRTIKNVLREGIVSYSVAKNNE